MKIVKYIFAGGIAAAVDLAIFFIFANIMGLNYLVIGAIGFVIATFVNYIISIHVVFNSGVRFNKNLEITFVYIVSAVGLGIHQLVLFITVEVVVIHLMVSKITAMGTVFLWNFAMRNYFIFKEMKKRDQVV